MSVARGGEGSEIIPLNFVFTMVARLARERERERCSPCVIDYSCVETPEMRSVPTFAVRIIESSERIPFYSLGERERESGEGIGGFDRSGQIGLINDGENISFTSCRKDSIFPAFPRSRCLLPAFVRTSIAIYFGWNV